MRPFLYLLLALAATLSAPAQGQTPYTPKFSRVTLAGPLADIDLTVAGTPNPNVVMLGHGNRISFCPLLSCINGPPDGTLNPTFFDHQRTSLLVSAVTQDDGHSEEQTLTTLTTIGTGRQKSWAANTTYSLGDNVTVGNAVYRAVTGGTTGGTNPLPGSRPNTAPFNVQDGSVRWLWINDGRISGKLGHYNEVTAVAGAGTTWAGVDNLQLNFGVVPSFHVAREIDLTNNSGMDCVIAVSNCYGLSIFLQGSNTSTAFLDMSSANTGPYAAKYGILMGGSKSNSDHDISVQSSAAVGLDFGGFGGSTHAIATIRDQSTSPIGYNNQGAHSTAAYFDGSVSATAISLNGNYNAAITTNAANAAYSVVTKTGQKVCFNIFNQCLYHDAATNRLIYMVDNVAVFSVDSVGNAKFKGTVTPSTNVLN